MVVSPSVNCSQTKSFLFYFYTRQIYPLYLQNLDFKCQLSRSFITRPFHSVLLLQSLIKGVGTLAIKRSFKITYFLKYFN